MSDTSVVFWKSFRIRSCFLPSLCPLLLPNKNGYFFKNLKTILFKNHCKMYTIQTLVRKMYKSLRNPTVNILRSISYLYTQTPTHILLKLYYSAYAALSLFFHLTVCQRYLFPEIKVLLIILIVVEYSLTWCILYD